MHLAAASDEPSKLVPLLTAFMLGCPQVLAVEVLWTPQEEGDYFTRAALFSVMCAKRRCFADSLVYE